METLSLNGKNLQWEFRRGQQDKKGKDKQEFSLYL